MPDLTGMGSYAAFFLTTALSYSIICLGLNLQWGQTGLFNVGVAGFVAIGAYASAIVTTPPTGAHLGGFAMPIAFGLAAAILGGIGSVPGALAGGLVVGLGEAVAVQTVGAEWRGAVAFLLLIFVLIVRPTGIFGRRD